MLVYNACIMLNNNIIAVRDVHIFYIHNLPTILYYLIVKQKMFFSQVSLQINLMI